MVLPKGSNLGLTEPLGPATNLQKTQRTEETCGGAPWLCTQQNPDCENAVGQTAQDL